MSSAELTDYTVRQLNAFFPDGRTVSTQSLAKHVRQALERAEYCFGRVAYPSFSDVRGARFDPQNSDQYCMYLYFLANTVHRNQADDRIATKLFYLNKALHAFNCMYDTTLPSVFWIVHAVGIVLGKATYSDYLVVHQNSTIGSLAGEYPTLGSFVLLSAGAGIIGRSRIGTNVVAGPGCVIVKRDVPDNSLVTGPDVAIRALSDQAVRSLFRLNVA